MSIRILCLSILCGLAGCSSVGMVPRDTPPPEPPPADEPAAADEPADPPPPRDYQLSGNRLQLPVPIAFQPGNDQLDPASDPALEHARSYLAAKDYITTMRIEGHAEDQALSELRAVAVARWLVDHGVDCKRLIAVGFGPNKPVADASTPAGRAENTRVELHNAALRGHPIGGEPLEGGGNPAATDLCH